MKCKSDDGRKGENVRRKTTKKTVLSISLFSLLSAYSVHVNLYNIHGNETWEGAKRSIQTLNP